MKKIPLLIVLGFLVGCSTNDGYIFESFGYKSHRERGITHYIHLAVGDSLGYDWTGSDTNYAYFYTVVEHQVEFEGHTYYRLSGYSFPFSGECPTGGYFIREDDNGNVYLSDSVQTYLLYQTNVEVGSTWYFGDLKCTLESRTDTVTTNSGTFTNCLRINIGSHWVARELDWLAPGIGLVRKNLHHITFEPLCLPWIDLTDLRLKNISRR